MGGGEGEAKSGGARVGGLLGSPCCCPWLSLVLSSMEEVVLAVVVEVRAVVEGVGLVVALIEGVEIAVGIIEEESNME